VKTEIGDIHRLYVPSTGAGTPACEAIITKLRNNPKSRAAATPAAAGTRRIPA
jgi:hypothetical protein